jgi:hypothetical protein
MNPNMKIILVLILLAGIWANVNAQKKTVLVDVGHGQKFYSDPADNISTQLVPAERLTYMTGELSKNAATSNATIAFQKSAITSEVLAKVKVLFIHVPSAKYTAEEVTAIQQFVAKGGSLFLVSEVDYWATLDQTNVNDILKPFGITFKGDHPDGAATGGHAETTAVTAEKYKIPYHGARLVDGGTPFAYSDKDNQNPFGVYKEVKGGGKIVAMGEGMVSLYMTSWQGVTDFQCSGFMGAVFAWLLK